VTALIVVLAVLLALTLAVVALRRASRATDRILREEIKR
jgi:hypothetical protein